MRPANRFITGKSVYKCRSCERLTRQTGRGDCEHIDLCEQCYELAGIENAITDGASPKEYALQILQLYGELMQKKGAQIPVDWDLLREEAIKAIA